MGVDGRLTGDFFSLWILPGGRITKKISLFWKWRSENAAGVAELWLYGAEAN